MASESHTNQDELAADIQLSVINTLGRDDNGVANPTFEPDEEDCASGTKDRRKNVSSVDIESQATGKNSEEESTKGSNRVFIIKETLEKPGWNEGNNINNNNNISNHARNGKISPSNTASTTVLSLGSNGDVAGQDLEREQWDKPIEFLLSCISMSVGLGNVWRFPFTCYDNGGGCFLIVYLIVLTFIGRPIYFLELFIGQFSSSGPITVWKVVPFLKGVGYGQMCGVICVVSFYVSIMATTVFFFFSSIRSRLPWVVCDEAWAGGCNENQTASTVHPNRTLAQLYFQNEVLKQKENIDDGLGYPEWRLSMCLLASWLVIFFVLFKGVRSSGKTAYFTSLFPYVVIFAFLIQGVLLDGAWEGIQFFVIPQWDRLYDIKIWYAAAGQCFLSLGTGFGTITMLASYNQFSHNIYKDAWIISVADTITSLLVGVTIFAILGNLAKELDVDISKVVDAGPGLAFESLPYAVSRFRFIPQVFSLLFFFMLFTIGLGSACSLTNAVVTVFCDEFPSLKRWHLVGSICLGGFLVGLIYVTPGGQFMVTLVDYYGVSFLLYVMAVLEVIGVSWFYGMDNVKKDIEFMLKFKLGWYWIICWKYVVPVSLTGILIYSIITAEPLKHNGVEFPEIALTCGLAMAIATFILIPVCAGHSVYTMRGATLWEKLKKSLQPAEAWGPQELGIRASWFAFKTKLN